MAIQDETFDKISKAIDAGQVDATNAKHFISRILLPGLREGLTAAGLGDRISDVEADLEDRILAEATAAARSDLMHRSNALEAAWDAMRNRTGT